MQKKKIKLDLDPMQHEEVKEHTYNTEDEGTVSKWISLDPDYSEEDEDHMSNTEEEYESEDDSEEELLSNRPNMSSAYWSSRMELFSVHVKLKNKESLDKLFGAITLVDCRTADDIFDPKTGDTRASKSHPGWTELILTGPRRCIEAADFCCILMRLTKNKRLLKPHKRMGPDYYWHLPDIWKGITWESTGGTFGSDRHLDLNKHLFEHIKTTFGEVQMEYALLSCAMAAIVEVQLDTINNNDDDIAYVYGTITARTTDLEGCERVLFCKTKMAAEKVKYGELIPLTRTSVCGTFGSRLEICLDLWIHNDVPGIDNDQKIVSSKFQTEKIAKDNRKFNKSLPGSLGNINVKVTWSSR